MHLSVLSAVSSGTREVGTLRSVKEGEENHSCRKGRIFHVYLPPSTQLSFLWGEKYIIAKSIIRIK